MRLKVRNQLQMMRSSETLSEAIGTKDNNVVFRVYVDVDAPSAVKNNVLFLEYNVSPIDAAKVITPKFSAAASSKIYQISSLRSEKLQRDNELVIYSGRVDITKYLPNDKLKEIKSGAPLRRSNFFGPSNSQSSINPPRPISGAVSNVVPGSSVAKKTYKTIAEYRKKDPAHELNSKPSHAPVAKIFSGFRTTGNYQETDLHFEAARLDMQKSGNTSSTIQISKQNVNFITVPLDIEVPKGEVGSYSLSVKALKNKIQVQKINQIIDFSKILSDATVPSIAPAISITDNGTTRKISVKRTDPRTAEIRIYRKLLNKDNAIDDSYELVANLSTFTSDSFNIPDRPSSMQQGIYRAVSYDASGKTVGEFSSVLIGKSRTSKQRSTEDPATIFAYESSSGVQITIYNVPYGVVAVKIIRRNLTIREKAFSSPASIRGDVQKTIDRETTSVSFIDLPLRPDSVFEYKALLTDTRGNVYETQRSSVVDYIGSKGVEESKSLLIQDHRIDSDGSQKTVSFQIDVSTSSTSLEQVYDILSSTGLDAQYIDEIKSNRELLNKITALEVVRFDCATGLLENFGVVKPGVFEDSPRTRSVYNVSSVVSGRNYVYFARLLVRSPGTIFSQVNLSRTDIETGKAFITNLKKYNSPKVLRKGSLSSNVVQKRAISATGLATDLLSSTSDEMIAGATSTTATVGVNVPQKDPEINEIFVRKTQRGNEISWNLFPNGKKIDHVIVHADYNGRLAPLRAIHFDGNSKMIFLDEELAFEPTLVIYYVQAVYTNYDMGPKVGPARSR